MKKYGDLRDYSVVVHSKLRRAFAEGVQQERERCADVAENPGFIEARDTEWDEGVNYAKRYIAEAIRRGEN